MRHTGFPCPTNAEIRRTLRARDRRRRRTLAERRRSGGKRPQRGGTFRQIKAATWARLCAQVRQRDGNRCRYCGAPAAGASVDHILPRRIFEFDNLENLACLCPAHHGIKTSEVECELFTGDLYKLFRWLDVIRQTGPVPAMQAVEAALGRLAQFLPRPEHVRRRRA